jgi:chromate transport protein ChrA
MAQVKRKALRTAGNTPNMKAILALVFPAVGTVVLALVNEYATVHLDSTLKVAIVGLVNAALAALGAWVGAPGQVIVNE